jgi:Flp pilus assembly protein TadG
MRSPGFLSSLARPAARLRHVGRLQHEEAGNTAIEFAIVATPFMMFIFGLVGCAFYFFIMSSVEKGMDQASRLVRTGQAVTDNMTVDQFKQTICDGAGKWLKCPSLQIFVTRWPDWASVKPQICVDANKVLITNTAPGDSPIATYSGTASDIVMVTACYKWNFTSTFPFLKLGNMPDGSLMMQTTTAFRSEPFPGT